MSSIHHDGQTIIQQTIEENLPHSAVEDVLNRHPFSGKVTLFSIGKAAWSMAKAASDVLGDQIEKGFVVTKYEHSQGPLPSMEIFEAGHPLLDENTLSATDKIVSCAATLTEKDNVLFLVSGGGSALFELPHPGISLEDLTAVNQQMLASGADIGEFNTVRKRFSQVKAGRFAQLCAPAPILSIVLSDVLGDRLDMIASGPAASDPTTKEDAWEIANKYGLTLTPAMKEALDRETPKTLDNVTTVVRGSVSSLVQSASKAAHQCGYTPYVLTTTLDCQAKEAGRMLGAIVQDTVAGRSSFTPPCAIIAGGETVVKLTGDGKGGRNQELALAAAPYLTDLENVVVFSLGSDGTDGPTDAAGAMVDPETVAKLEENQLTVGEILENNNAYPALKAIDNLIFTGPTGTNVNDVSVALIK